LRPVFFPEGQVRVFVSGEPVSMRFSFDGLYGLVQNRMGQDPLSGHLFAFINRRAATIKVLYFDRCGLCVWSKRLEQGRLITDWAAVRTRQTDWTGLQAACSKASNRSACASATAIPQQVRTTCNTTHGKCGR
jgi:transposase